MFDPDQFEERAAIMQYDGGMSKFKAETAAAESQGVTRWEAIGNVAKRVVVSAEAKSARMLLRYEPESGKLFWRERRASQFQDGSRHTAEIKCKTWNARYAGREAFTARNAYGYAVGNIWRKQHFAHRVIWLMQTGGWPKEVIDHINGVQDDNRWENLRSVSVSENGRNKKVHENNTSGAPGVYWAARDKKYRAQITIENQVFSLGSFSTFKEAAQARKNAEKEHGFTVRTTQKARDNRKEMAQPAGKDDVPGVQPDTTKEN